MANSDKDQVKNFFGKAVDGLCNTLLSDVDQAIARQRDEAIIVVKRLEEVAAKQVTEVKNAGEKLRENWVATERNILGRIEALATKEDFASFRENLAKDINEFKSAQNKQLNEVQVSVTSQLEKFQIEHLSHIEKRQAALDQKLTAIGEICKGS